MQFKGFYQKFSLALHSGMCNQKDGLYFDSFNTQGVDGDEMTGIGRDVELNP